MSIIAITALAIGLALLFFALGLPVAFTLAGIAIILSIFLWGPGMFLLAAYSAFSSMSTFILVAIPLFILMGNVLERSGIAEAFYETIHLWMGRLNGGLAIASVIVCTFMAAMVGVIAAGIVTMGIIALPAMLNRDYDKHMAAGSIMAGGGLGSLIPPSVIMMLYSLVARQSVGRMFMGGIIPGFVLSALYCIYIAIRCALRPEMGPALPPEARGTWKEKFVSLRGSILPVALIVVVLGSIFMGLATPSEASAIGAIGAFICAAIYRKLNWTVIKESVYATAKLFGVIFWIIIGAECFSRFYLACGASELISGLFLEREVNRWFILIGMQISLILLGMIMEEYAIVMVVAPIYVPIIMALGFNPLWFGILFIVNTQIAVLTPPYGFALFYMRAIIPPDMTMGDLYRAIIPFVGLQIIGLAMVMAFPQLALWLPGLMFKAVG